MLSRLWVAGTFVGLRHTADGGADRGDKNGGMQPSCWAKVRFCC